MGLASVAASALAAGRSGVRQAARWSPSSVIARAVDAVGRAQQTWSRPDLVRAVSDALPGDLRIAPEKVGPLLEHLTDQAAATAVTTRPAEPTTDLPEDFRLENGRSAYEQPASVRYAAPGQIAAEQAIERAGRLGGAPHMSSEEANAAVARFAENGHELGEDQKVAVRGVLSSDAQVETLAAAAGAGKSFVVGAVAEAWTPGRTIGLAPSQSAAMVLADEGVPSMNLTAWINAQRRGQGDAMVRAGDLVVVDEAGMAPTQDIAEVVRRVGQAGGKVLLVGDPRQLGAVGPGGVLADIGARGAVYELTEVRRFRGKWEGEASLRLRDADPTALDQYDRHGRIRDGGTADEAGRDAARAWLADTLDGRESLLVVATNEQAGQAAGQLRAQLVRLGRVEDDGTLMGRDGNVAGIGDRVQARRNGWELDEVEGNTRVPINRDTYTVARRLDNGSLTVVDSAGVEIHLPAGYVAADLALAYATTVHGAQGRTVDTAHTVVTPGADAGSVYVGLTRGRDANTAWVVTRALPEKSPTGEAVGKDAQPGIEPRSARAVVTELLERAEEERGALAETEQARKDAVSAVRSVDRLIDGINVATAGRVPGLLDALTTAGSLSDRDREALAADPATGAAGRLLRAGELAGRPMREVLHQALHDRPLDGARNPGQVLFARVQQIVGRTPAASITSFHDLLPTGLPEGVHRYLSSLAEAADTRRRELGTEASADPPEWAVERLGPPPTDPLARADWETGVGWAAAWRENQDTDTARPDTSSAITADTVLGAAPPPGLSEKRAVWVTAVAGLGGPGTGPEEANMTDGQLLNRVAAYDRERVWAPRWVADELAATAEEAARQKVDATVWEADATTHPGPTAEAAALARAQAAELERLRAELAEVDETRARWFAHTAAGKERHDRAVTILNGRGVDPRQPREHVTAEEWMADDTRIRATEDRRRPIRETDVIEPATAEAPALDESTAADLGEVRATDIRQTAVMDDSETRQPARQVPAPDTTAVAVARAREALDEIADRHSLDQTETDDEDAADTFPWWVGLGDDTTADTGDWVDTHH